MSNSPEGQTTQSVGYVKSHRLKLPAQSWSLGEIRSFCRDVLCSYSIDPRSFRQLILAVDEAAANVVEHAYLPGTSKDVELEIRVHSDHVSVEIRDTGIVFDPLAVLKSERPTGSSRDLPRRGYGLPLIRRIMDEIRYSRTEDGVNVLQLIKHLDTG